MREVDLIDLLALLLQHRALLEDDFFQMGRKQCKILRGQRR